MNARFRMPIVALCIAGVLAGCGSVTQGTQFTAPTGWTASPSILGRVQMWFKSGKGKNSTEILMLVKGNSDTPVGFNEVPQQYGGKDMKVLSQGKTTFCGTQAGEQFRAEGTDKDGHKNVIEMTTALIDKDRYIAMYIRPSGVPADSQAETAIHGLCPVAK